ncbi:hypothetical protein [Vibrio rumoiensis]|uniref:Bacterial toxin YdaT domain-containing protein n=1 Tax=Vibrio rumoiensis TaxID=76258 RepID=A0ABW7J0E6_9VIBR
MKSLKAVTRHAMESWRCELSKDAITSRVARMYHKLDLQHEEDAQPKQLLKPVGADDKNNWQNFFRANERTSDEAKATMMDLLPAILTAMPAQRACDMLNHFLNQFGFSVTVIGANDANANRDQLLLNHNKETSEAFRAVISLGENASVEQLREAYREVQEGKDSHTPILEYLESLMSKKAA